MRTRLHRPSLLHRALACLAALPLLAALPAAAQHGDEVPFITSPDNVTLQMLEIAGVKAGDHLIDLGSGDGRIVITAARRYGATGLGVEIVPDLVARSRRAAQEAGVADKVRFEEQDLFATDLSRASVVTMYLLPEVNLQLRPRLLQLAPGTRVVSHDWDMGDWAPDRTVVLDVPDKQVGREKKSKVHLWTVPARVEGLWCGNGLLREFSLRLSQQYQQARGELVRRDRVRAIEGTIDGRVLRTQATRVGALVLEQVGEELKVVDGDGPLAMARGTSFRKAAGAGCAG